jgi:hypothetical protein
MVCISTHRFLIANDIGAAQALLYEEWAIAEEHVNQSVKSYFASRSLLHITLFSFKKFQRSRVDLRSGNFTTGGTAG